MALVAPEPTLWWDLLGFLLYPEVLGGSRVAAPITFLSISWAAINGLVNSKNCDLRRPGL